MKPGKATLLYEFRAGAKKLLLLVLLIGIAGCNEGPKNQPPQEKKAQPETKAKTGQEKIGVASWYGPDFDGKETASGETFNQNKMTAASPTLPLGTKAEVTNVETGKKVEVKINDRGPYAKHRAIDLSKAAAKKIGITKKGASIVKIKVKARPKRKKNRHYRSPCVAVSC